MIEKSIISTWQVKREQTRNVENEVLSDEYRPGNVNFMPATTGSNHNFLLPACYALNRASSDNGMR